MQTAIEKPDDMTPPTHVAIIMDGNGRWAKSRGLPRAMGHKSGAEAVRRVAALVFAHYALSCAPQSAPRCGRLCPSRSRRKKRHAAGLDPLRRDRVRRRTHEDALPRAVDAAVGGVASVECSRVRLQQSVPGEDVRQQKMAACLHCVTAGEYRRER